MSFNLDQLTGWYMIGRLTKNIKITIFIAQNRLFYTFGLVNLLNLKVNVLLNCANCNSQKKFQMISTRLFLTFVSVDLLHQMSGLSLYLEKLVQNSPPIHTHTHTQTYTYTHIINLMTYLDRSTASFWLFVLGKGSSGQNCFHQTKCDRLRVI